MKQGRPKKTLSESPEKSGNYSFLCRPDRDRSCFRCCPPIRPAGYDHAAHEARLRRLLRENTKALARQGPRAEVIDGSSCWGLGFLDYSETLVGCLLHPARNQGRDFRDLTGYGDKCRRELCREAVVFAELPPSHTAFVLDLSQGLDSFGYSSPKKNPVFRLLMWGPKVIEHLTAIEPRGLSREEYRKKWAVLDNELDPERDGFPVETLLDRLGLADLARPDFLGRYHKAMHEFIAGHKAVMTPPLDNRPYVHQLGQPASLARFLRLALGWFRAAPSQAEALRRKLEAKLARL